MCDNNCDNCPRHLCDCRPGIVKENKYKLALQNINAFLNLTEGKSNNFRMIQVRDLIDEVLYDE